MWSGEDMRKRACNVMHKSFYNISEFILFFIYWSWRNRFQQALKHYHSIKLIILEKVIKNAVWVYCAVVQVGEKGKKSGQPIYSVCIYHGPHISGAIWMSTHFESNLQFYVPLLRPDGQAADIKIRSSNPGCDKI